MSATPIHRRAWRKGNKAWSGVIERTNRTTGQDRMLTYLDDFIPRDSRDSVTIKAVEARLAQIELTKLARIGGVA